LRKIVSDLVFEIDILVVVLRFLSVKDRELLVGRKRFSSLFPQYFMSAMLGFIIRPQLS
jgi:hypothetical protein